MIDASNKKFPIARYLACCLLFTAWLFTAWRLVNFSDWIFETTHMIIESILFILFLLVLPVAKGGFFKKPLSLQRFLEISLEDYLNFLFWFLLFAIYLSTSIIIGADEIKKIEENMLFRVSFYGLGITQITKEYLKINKLKRK